MKRFLIAGLFLLTSIQTWGAATYNIPAEETAVTSQNSHTYEKHQLVKQSSSPEKQLATTFEGWAQLPEELQLKVLSFLPSRTLGRVLNLG